MKEPVISRIKDIIREKTGSPAEHMVSAVYQKQGHKLFLEREKIRHGINTIDDWQVEKKRIRKNFLEAIGGLLLDEQVKIKYCGEIRKKNLIVKKLLFSPYGNHWASANLYIPLERKGRIPAVILPAGHTLEGKSKDQYRERAVLFAVNGYAALTFDYIGCGERNLLNKDGGIDSFTSTQHNIVGSRMNLYACNLQSFMLSETIAAIDVVSAQPEVDPEKICMTGSSGGGVESFFSAALDERIKACAPAACIRSYSGKIETDDAEQVFFNPITSALGYPDIASFLIAPRPLLIVANKKDIWGMEQVEYFIDEVKAFYKLNDAEDKFSQSFWDRGHVFENDQVEVTVKWFNRWLKHDAEFIASENIDQADIPAEEECRVTEKGNLFLSGFPTPIKLFSEYADTVHKAQTPAAKAIEAFIADNNMQVDSKQQFEWELVDSYRIGDISGKRIIFSPEENIWLPVEVLIPEKVEKIMILLDEGSRMNDIERQIKYAADNCLTVRPDMRGFGDTEGEDSWPDKENWAQQVYQGKRYRLAALAGMVGRILLLDRAQDISALISVLSVMGYKQEITIHGKRNGALTGIFTALRDHRVKRLILKDCLTSYWEHLSEEFPVSWGDELVYGILKKGIDIPDLLEYLQVNMSKQITYTDN